MPNWCENVFNLSGPVDVVRQLWEKAQTNNSGLLEAMAPIGKWDYGTANRRWGTKWDIDIKCLDFTVHDDDQGRISGVFESAWAPPIAALEEWKNNHPECVVELEYFEPSGGFIGAWNSSDGDQCYTISSNDLSNIPQHLREQFSVNAYYQIEEEDELTKATDESKDAGC